MLPTPFQVGDVEFDLGDVYEGPRGTLSLVVLLDRPVSKETASRAFWSVQRLVRALDARESRRSVTAVLLGGPIDGRLLSDLQSIARVLVLAEGFEVRRLLSPLLPMSLKPVVDATSGALDRLRKGIESGRDSEALGRILGAAGHGASAVESEYAHWVDAAIGARTRGGTT